MVLQVTRDTCHCIDLGSKDSAQCPVFADLIADIKSLMKILCLDRVQAIMEELVATNAIAK